MFKDSKMPMKAKFQILGITIMVFNIFSPAWGGTDIHSKDMETISTLHRNQEWLRSGWGVRVVLPSASTKQISEFDIKALADQIGKLQTASWVMLNLTEGATGSFFTSTDKQLNAVSSLMVPTRDLFGEAVNIFRSRGFRVIVYFAAQGPGSDKNKKLIQKGEAHLEKLKKINLIDEAWKNFIANEGVEHNQAVALYCIESFARRYKDKIDGWWFDHGNWGDPHLFHESVIKSNPYAEFAWNDSSERSDLVAGFDGKRKIYGWKLGRSNEFETYTNGHVTPTTSQPPWWEGNEVMVEQVEQSKYIDGLIPHLFFPLQSSWRYGDSDFPEKQLINWVERIISSDGGVTIAVALKSPEFHYPQVGAKQFKQLKYLDKYLADKYPQLIRSAQHMHSNK